MNLKLLLCAYVVSLWGCSNAIPGVLLFNNKNPDSSGNPQNSVRFEPYEVPSSPASPQHIETVLGDLKKAFTYIPEDPAFMRAIIVGDKVRDIFRGSQERIQALRKLTPDGYYFLNRITRDCALSPATRKDTGSARPGSSARSVLTMASSGPACEYVFQKELDKNVAASAGSFDAASGVYRWTETHQHSYKEDRRVLNGEIQRLANVTHLQRHYSTNGTVDLAASNSGYDIVAKFQSSGFVKVEFADGETLEGPFYSQTISTDKKLTTKLRFEGRTSAGNILIFALRDPMSPLKVFINGQQVPADILKFFGFSSMLEPAYHRD